MLPPTASLRFMTLPICVCCLRSCAVECKCRRDEKPFPSEMTKPPQICLDLLCSPKVALLRVLTRLNLTNCLIHLQPIVVVFFVLFFLKLEAASRFPGKNCKCLQKSGAARHPEAPLAPPAPPLMYATDNPIHKEPVLSYLSSCFRYFCKLRGGRIINHSETRWQSASIVAKKTNETAHPGKRPGDAARYRLPALANSRYTGSLSRSLPWCTSSRPGPDKATKANQRGSLSVCSITGLFQIW